MKVMVGEIQGEEKEVKSFNCFELKTSFASGHRMSFIMTMPETFFQVLEKVMDKISEARGEGPPAA